MGLDLSRIDAWTREMLEAEARRRRIRNPEFRTRGDLIRLVLKHQYGDRVSAAREGVARGMRTARQARELFGLAVDAAISALPEPFGALVRLRSPEAPPPRAPTPTRTAPVTPAASVEPQVQVVPPQQPPTVAIERTSVAIACPAESTHAPSVPAIGATAPALRGGASIAATTRTFIEEPIRTRTMARLLAAQGHRERALVIYEELLAQNSADDAIQLEADAVRRGELPPEAQLPEPTFGADRWSLPDADDRLACAGDPSAGLVLRWSVSDSGQLRAGAVLGERGELALRVISIEPDAERVVRSQITEHGPVGEHGEWKAPPLAPGARCFAAVGLRAGDRFVAIVHAHPRASAESAAAPSPAPL